MFSFFKKKIKSVVPDLNPNSKVIIGIGDSFTQGVGSWSESTYLKYNNKVNTNKIDPTEFEEMYQNSWVNQLTLNYLSDYIPINLGIEGIGNRAAAGELFLNPDLKFENISSGYIIFMLSGLDRFDYVSKNYRHLRHFVTAWPQEPHKGIKMPKSWKSYKEEIWSEKASVIETLLSIKNVQCFAELHNLKLILISAFDQRYNETKFKQILGTDMNLADTIPWERFIYPNGMPSCINLLVDLEGKPQELAYGDFWPYYNSLDEPSRYISNCAHPTKEGHNIIANEICKFIKKDL